jgi:hypothetical protein
MKTTVGLVLAAMVALTVLAGAVRAEEPNGQKEGVTQGELAVRLVMRLGLWRDAAIPLPSVDEAVRILLAKGITATDDGWQVDEPVTAAMLARILVLALGGGPLVPADQQNNVEAWMEALKKLMVDLKLIETVGGALAAVVPDAGVRDILQWFNLAQDELRARKIPVADLSQIFGGPVFGQTDMTPDMGQRRG